MTSLSKNRIESYRGDVVALRLSGEGIDRKSDIKWSVSGDACSIRDFSCGGDVLFTDGVLVSLDEVGHASVCATYEGEEYVCEVAVSPMMDTPTEDALCYCFGDMHCHTSENHKHDQFMLHENEDISDYVEYQRRDGALDLAVISDHSDVTNSYDFFRGFELAEGSSPVIMAGAESEVMYTERDRFDILHRHSGELVTLMTSGYASVKTFEEFKEEMRYSKYGFAIFAHPHVVGFSTNGIWNFDFQKRNDDFMLSLMRGIEMGNGEDRKENLLHEYAYPAALDAGFHVSTTAGSDCHGPRWGYDIMPGKTVIMARDKSKEAIHEAFLKNRFYATESGNIKLEYRVNGVKAPDTLPIGEVYDFEIKIGYFRDDEATVPTRVDIISDYGRTVASVKPSGEVTRLTVRSSTARYFYVRLVDGAGRKTWSYPVFTGREYDKPREPRLTPIDMSECAATSGGIDVARVINGNPFDSWYSTESTPTIEIDIGREMDIAGFGYYPHIILRAKDKGPDWTTSMESSKMVSRYRILASLDGVNYSEISSEVARTLGKENIIDFAPVLARFIRMEVLGNIGVDSGIEKYKDSKAAIGNISLFTQADI